MGSGQKRYFGRAVVCVFFLRAVCEQYSYYICVEIILFEVWELVLIDITIKLCGG